MRLPKSDGLYENILFTKTDKLGIFSSSLRRICAFCQHYGDKTKGGIAIVNIVSIVKARDWVVTSSKAQSALTSNNSRPADSEVKYRDVKFS